MDKKRLSITVPENMKEELQKLAASRDRGVSYIVREAIEQYLERNKAI